MRFILYLIFFTSMLSLNAQEQKHLYILHGTKDHTIENGSHMMTLTDFKKEQVVLDKILR